jgi:hypothetical protein
MFITIAPLKEDSTKHPEQAKSRKHLSITWQVLTGQVANTDIWTAEYHFPGG